MPVVSAVLTLSDSTLLRGDALRFLHSDPSLELGEPVRGRYPVVLCTDTRDHDKALWRSLQDHAGITHLELAFADFSDLQNEGTQS